MKLSRTFWSSDTKSAPANHWFTLSLPPGPSPGSRCHVRQSSTTRRSALLCLPPERLLQPSRAHQRKDFLVISLNFPSLAFITSLMSSNPLARSCSVETASQTHFQHLPGSHFLHQLPLRVSHHSPRPWTSRAPAFLVLSSPPSQSPALGAGRSLQEFAGASKTWGQDPANSVAGEVGLLGSRDCLLCSQL